MGPIINRFWKIHVPHRRGRLLSRLEAWIPPAWVRGAPTSAAWTPWSAS